MLTHLQIQTYSEARQSREINIYRQKRALEVEHSLVFLRYCGYLWFKTSTSVSQDSLQHMAKSIRSISQQLLHCKCQNKWVWYSCLANSTSFSTPSAIFQPIVHFLLTQLLPSFSSPCLCSSPHRFSCTFLLIWKWKQREKTLLLSAKRSARYKYLPKQGVVGKPVIQWLRVEMNGNVKHLTSALSLSFLFHNSLTNHPVILRLGRLPWGSYVFGQNKSGTW